MPVRTVEQLSEREVTLAKKVAALADSKDPKVSLRKRAAQKRLRRTQRRRRVLVAAAKRRAPKTAEKKS
jgi:hypothetical protein